MSDTKVVVRPPGGDFGAPAPIGRALTTDVAVAPGGWAALARDVDDAATTTVLAPGRHATLGDPDPAARRGAADRRRRPRDGDGGLDDLRLAQPPLRPARVGRRAADLPRRARPPRRRAGRGAVRARPVSPAGRTIVAWADGRGIRASVDGGAPERLSTEAGAGSPAVAVADDGSAVVAYAGMRDRVLVTSRGAGGAWTLPRLLRGPRAPGDTVDGLAQDYIEALIAPDGRAAVAWNGPDVVGGRAFAASGRPGGEWTPAAPLSAVTRDAFSPELLRGAGRHAAGGMVRAAAAGGR